MLKFIVTIHLKMCLQLWEISFSAFTISVLTAASAQVFVGFIIARLGLLDGFLLCPFSRLFSALHFDYNYKHNAFQFAVLISFLIFVSHYGFNF